MPSTEPGKKDNLKIPFYFKGIPFKLRSQSPLNNTGNTEDIITSKGPGLVDIKYGGGDNDATITNEAAESVTADPEVQATIEEGDDVFGGGGFADTSGGKGVEQLQFDKDAANAEDKSEFRSDLQSRIDTADTPQKKQRLQDRMNRKSQKDKVKAANQKKKGEKKMTNLNKKKGGKWKM